jgi:hypothetical protein
VNNRIEEVLTAEQLQENIIKEKAKKFAKLMKHYDE